MNQGTHGVPGQPRLRDLIHVAACNARHGRSLITLQLPAGWHREHEWEALFHAACGPPAAAGPTRPGELTGPARPDGHTPARAHREYGTSRRTSQRRTGHARFHAINTEQDQRWPGLKAVDRGSAAGAPAACPDV